MNRSFEKQRMPLKSSRSLLPGESKRAAKTISCMRNGKVSSGPVLGAVSPAKPESSAEEGCCAAELALKQEPEDEAYYDEAELLQGQEDEDDQEHDSPPTLGQQQLGGHSRPSYPTMLTRVRSHSRSLRAMANPSAVWAHFDLCSNDPLRAQCRICGAVVVRGGANPRQCGTTNLHRHLRVHHGGRLIGRRYQVMSDKRDHGHEQTQTAKALRIATQNLVRQMRQIAPAPSQQASAASNAQRQAQRVQQAQQQQTAQAAQQQHQRPLLQPKPTKTLVLKTIPLKVKQIAPTTIKMPPHAVRHSLQNLQQMPQTILPQQPTEVCLRWNSYHSNMQHSFPSLLDSEQFVDVTLACEGRSLKCHKMILSSCSDYLAQLLRENPCQHPIILMRDLKFWEVEALVKFMYRGEVNVTHDKLPQLLNAAEALQVKGLAGPSNTQSPKPPLLIPQSKAPSSRPQPAASRAEAKEKPSSSGAPGSTNFPSSSAGPSSASPRRGQKRRNLSSAESPEARPFTKIRLQRPAEPGAERQPEPGGPGSPGVKLEPPDVAGDMPLSPGDHLYQTHTSRDDEDDSEDAPTFESIIRMHQEDDPGGDELELADAGSDYDNNDAEEHMEFVPTDFLEQEDIVEDSEDQANRNSVNYTDDDSKQNNEEENEDEEEYGDEDEEDEAAAKSEEESEKPERTKRDKDKT